MINFDDYTNENKINHNLNWLYIPDHPWEAQDQEKQICC